MAAMAAKAACALGTWSESVGPAVDACTEEVGGFTLPKGLPIKFMESLRPPVTPHMVDMAVGTPFPTSHIPMSEKDGCACSWRRCARRGRRGRRRWRARRA